MQITAPGLWLAASLLVGLAGLGFLILGGERGEQVARLAPLRWLLIPYAGLLAGAISPRRMGLSEIDWLISLGWGLGLILLLLGLLAVAHLGHTARPGPPTSAGAASFALLRAGLQEFHWSFWRAGLWALFLSLDGEGGALLARVTAQPAYWAVWGAAALALAELGTAILVGRMQPTAGVSRLFIVLATSVLFLYTRNFWLCWLLHAGMQAILGGWSTGRNLPPQSPPTTRPRG